MPGSTIVNATSLEAVTAGEWERLATDERQRCVATAGDGVLALLESQKDDPPEGFAVNAYTHALQCASRAARRGECEEFVVAALLHDIGHKLDPLNHHKIAAALLKPFVTEAHQWMVEHHQVFQLRYRAQSRFDRDACLKYRDHPYFDLAMEFAGTYDQASFDPDYRAMPLSEFVPVVKRIFTDVTTRTLDVRLPASAEPT